MDWFEVIRWVSLILCWVAITINVIAFIKTNRVYKRLKRSLVSVNELAEKLNRRLGQVIEDLENKQGENE